MWTAGGKSTVVDAVRAISDCMWQPFPNAQPTPSLERIETVAESIAEKSHSGSFLTTVSISASFVCRLRGFCRSAFFGGMLSFNWRRDHRKSVNSPTTRSVMTSSRARRYQSVPFPLVITSSSPRSFSTLTLTFSEAAGDPTPDRRFAMRNP